MKQFLCKYSRAQLGDRLLVMGLCLYALCLFLPHVTALERTGLAVAVLISFFGGRWRACLGGLRHPLMGMTLGLIAWFALSCLWSVEATLTREAVVNIFKDYLLLLPPLFYMLADRERRRLFCLGLAWAGAVVVLLNAAQYLREYWTDPGLLDNIKLHRGWGHPLVLFIPFALLQARLSRGTVAGGWYLLFVVEALMIFATGARGAWLALFAILILWLGHDCQRRRAAGIVVIGLLIAIASYFLLPDFLVKDRLASGFSTSLRTTGTWGPALQMLEERPLLGFGFGKEIFDREFNRRAPTEESWSFKRSKGPHSIYLEAGFSAGYPALILLSLLFAVALFYGMEAARRGATEEERGMALACLAAFAGFYVTRGAFESVQWAPMILLLAPLVHFSLQVRGSESARAFPQA